MKGADQCPVCGSTRALAIHLNSTSEMKNIRSCMECETAWEPYDPSACIDPTDPVSAFTAPCDNCAFRPHSPEREDAKEWRRLTAYLEIGGRFYCHKGVPLSKQEGQTHDQPKLPSGEHDTAKMRLCAGYLAWWLGWQKRIQRNMERLEREGEEEWKD